MQLIEKVTPRKILTALLLVFLLGIVFKIHGYSISSWRKPLEIEHGGIFNIGPPRGIRGDDWIVNFTFWKMQDASNPKNPQINTLIGFGQDLSLSPFVFVKHWSSFFKPHLWGFWWNVDFGMSWLWQFLSLGTFSCVYIILRRFLPEPFSPGVTIYMAAAFLFSNFFQLWSLISIPSFLYGAIGFLTFCGFLKASGRRKFVCAAGFIWAVTALGFLFYPPFQIPAIHLLLLSMAGFWFQQIKNKGLSYPVIRILFVFMFGVLGLVLFGLFLYEKKEAIQILLSTVYPGKRIITGGHLNWVRIVQDSIFPWMAVSNFSKLGGNICEAAGFLNFLPLLFILTICSWRRFDTPVKRVFVFWGSYQIFIFFWWIFGIPSWMAKVTGLSMVPPVRASGILGVTNLVFLALWFYSCRNQNLLSATESAWIKRGWSGAVGLIVGYLFLLSSDFNGLPWPQKLASLVLVGLVLRLSYQIINVNLPAFSRGFAALSLLLTFFFNPIVFGGGESLMKASPLIQEIRNVEKRGPEGAWIAFDHLITGHAPLLAGSRSFSGVYLYPDLKLWKILDPSGQYNHAWNRYAHVVFELDPAAKNPRISTPQGDVVIVTTALDSPVLLQLPFSYVMVPISKADQIPKRLYREEARTRDWILAVRLQKN